MAQFFLLPISQWFDNSGNPLNGGTVDFFQAGTSTRQDTFTDSTGGTAAANPVVLDSAGRAQIWLSAGAYKFVVKTSAGSTLLTVDNYNPANVNSTLTQLTNTGDLTLQQSTAATSGGNHSSNNLKIQSRFWNGSADATNTWNIQDVVGTGSNPTTTLTITQSGSSGTKDISIPSAPVTLGGLLSTKNLEAIRFADQFASGSNTGGISEAYADLPSAGGIVMLGADITISAAQTLALTDSKPLILEGNGRTITFSHTSGIGLAVTLNPNTTTRPFLIIRNCVFAYSGSSASITGVKLGSQVVGMVNCYVQNCQFNGFNSTSATALALSFFEDGHIENCDFNHNTLALSMDLNSNQNSITNCHFQSGTNAVQLTDTNNVSFLNCLVQGNSGQKCFQIASSTQTNQGFAIQDCWFENNGDTTSSSRHISLSAASTFQLARTRIIGCEFNGGSNFPAGATCVEATGAGTVTLTTFHGNTYSTGTATAGFAAGKKALVINDGAKNWDVALNAEGAESGTTPWGVSFNPASASKAFAVYGGFSGQNDGSLVFRDLTASSDIMLASSSGWTFKANAIIGNTTVNSTSGKATTYNGITTVSSGLPSLVATVGLGNQSAAISATTLFSPGTGQQGMYRVNVYLKVTQAATSSSALGGTTGVKIAYTDGVDGVSQNANVPMFDQTGAIVTTGTGNVGNSTTTVSQGTLIITVAASTTITYAIGYSSTGATVMKFEVQIILEKL